MYVKYKYGPLDYRVRISNRIVDEFVQVIENAVKTKYGNDTHLV